MRLLLQRTLLLIGGALACTAATAVLSSPSASADTAQIDPIGIVTASVTEVTADTLVELERADNLPPLLVQPAVPASLPAGVAEFTSWFDVVLPQADQRHSSVERDAAEPDSVVRPAHNADKASTRDTSTRAAQAGTDDRVAHADDRPAPTSIAESVPLPAVPSIPSHPRTSGLVCGNNATAGGCGDAGGSGGGQPVDVRGSLAKLLNSAASHALRSSALRGPKLLGKQPGSTPD